jgi:hypothetical protein
VKPSLIFCSVGQPLPTEGPYAENHWRRTDRGHREYRTTIVNYNHESGFVPEKYSYDFCRDVKGYKWPLAHKHLKMHYESIMKNYEYIGIWDDDIQTDIESLNHALIMAHNAGAKMFQLSLTQDSDEWFDILKHKPDYIFSWTNFIEIMCPVYHTSLIPMMIEFWDSYPFKMAWGFDKVACELAEAPAMVIHSKQMYHPRREESTYDKTAAFEEMRICMEEAYPAYCKKHFGIDSARVRDVQLEYSAVKRID